MPFAPGAEEPGGVAAWGLAFSGGVASFGFCDVFGVFVPLGCRVRSPLGPVTPPGCCSPLGPIAPLGCRSRVRSPLGPVMPLGCSVVTLGAVVRHRRIVVGPTRLSIHPLLLLGGWRERDWRPQLYAALVFLPFILRGLGVK